MTHTCAVSGEESSGKHYILRTTEGEELISPDALLNPVKFLEKIAREWGELKLRLDKLEDLISSVIGDQEQGQGDAAPAPAKKAAAKKTTAAKPGD